MISLRERDPKHVSNPLTLIAVFAALSETVSAAVLPILDTSLQGIFLWFVMLFPVFLVSIFFVTLWRKREVLYAPSDFKDEQNFLVIAGHATRRESTDLLRKFWKPDGILNEENAVRLRSGMSGNGLGHESVTFFLSSDQYLTKRDKAVNDLGLS